MKHCVNQKDRKELQTDFSRKRKL